MFNELLSCSTDRLYSNAVRLAEQLTTEEMTDVYCLRQNTNDKK